MADEQPRTVTVETLKYHTNAGTAYQVGDTYEVDEAAVDNLVHQGMAVRADRVAHAKREADDVEKARKASSRPVAPITTKDMGHNKPKSV